MKKILIPLATTALLLTTGACNSKTENVVLANRQDTLSWAMGMSLAETAKADFFQFDQDMIQRAFESTLKGENQPLDEQAYRNACQQMSLLMMQQQRATAESSAKDAKVRQDEYFAKLVKEKRKDLKKSSAGFYYEVLKNGNGVKAKERERIKFDFQSFNALTGQTITKTYGNREPIVHVISSSMFPGLFEGLQMMSAGSKFRFYFPYELCQNVGDLPAYTPVIYEVELHEIFKD